MRTEEERILWEVEASLEDAFKLCGRDRVIDYLAQNTREKLFEGYILKEHYDCLANKYQVLKLSHNLQHDAVMRTVYT